MRARSFRLHDYTMASVHYQSKPLEQNKFQHHKQCSKRAQDIEVDSAMIRLNTIETQYHVCLINYSIDKLIIPLFFRSLFNE